MANTFPTPKKYTAKLISKDQLNPRVAEVIIEMVAPTDLIFVPGQFISLSVGKGVFRSYSIASTHEDTKRISLLIEVAHEGAGANFIKGLSVGDPLEFIGPSGRFCLPEDIKPNIVFIVTGTGIAPIFSMLEYLAEIKSAANMKLYFGARNTSEVFKLDYIEQFKSKLPNFEYKLCYSNPLTEDEKLNPNILSGRVTENADISNTKDCLYVLCGHPFMIADMAKILIEKGVAQNNIIHEKFTVSKKTA